MPQFQAPTALKRKSDQSDDASRKRLATNSARLESDEQNEYWMVQWRNPQYKKYKTWDGDAVLAAHGNKATLYDSDGKTMVSGKTQFPLCEGRNFSIGGKEIELDRLIAPADYLSGKCFGKQNSPVINTTVASSTGSLAKKFVSPKLNQPDRVYALQVPLAQPRKSDGSSKPNSRGLMWTTGENKTSDMNVEGSQWTVNWRKHQSKKHKTWDGDAYVSHKGTQLIMISEDGKIMGSTPWKGQILVPGFHLYIGGMEIELDCQVSETVLPTIVARSTSPRPEDTIPVPPDPRSFSSMKVGSAPLETHTTTKIVPLTSSYGVPANAFYGAPVKGNPKGPLHDPEAEGAIVMKMPTKEHLKRFNKKDLPVVPVVLDPILSRRMREHQKEGVKFMYECVLGLRKYEGQGCILADEMGLGKTLQTISLVWTLLKQNPYAGVGPVVQKVLIVCPVSLINNWKAEFHKWLGKDRVGVVTCEKDNNVSKIFVNNKKYQVLVVGYERLKAVIADLASCVPPIGLIICDEGHRLKSANNKTAAVFQALRTPRRIILSGTPIQNDLGEFHTMAQFCNPGLLDDYTTFRRVYEKPILKSRAPDATAKEIEIGEARSVQLLTVAKSFVLRRDATLLNNYLPPKHEYVVFVTPTSLQLSIFSMILHPSKMDDLVHSSTAESLALMNILTKVSNSPILLKATAENARAKMGEDMRTFHRAGVDEALKLLPERAQIDDMTLSGKLIALSKMLEVLYKETDEKCVLVSHYTSTLNILEAFCKKMAYSFYRLDGQTPQGKRQEYVNAFNKSSQKSSFIFLLSSKAGGVGINLIGASRLCLIDSDWNPSHDLQSMARCHRDGQKRPVYIYRFLTAGAIDEKIYQRQVTKLGLSDSLMGSGSTNSKSDSFSRKDLRDIFRIHPDTACNTHDLLECPCDGSRRFDHLSSSLDGNLPKIEKDTSEMGFVPASDVKSDISDDIDRTYLQKKKCDLAALGEWSHINCLKSTAKTQVQDDVLCQLIHTMNPERCQDTSMPDTKLNTLLFAVDLENIVAMDDEMLPREAPGGTISFLFAKSTEATL